MTKLMQLFTVKTNLTTKKPHLEKSFKTLNRDGFPNKQCRQLSMVTKFKDGNFSSVF